ncbi:hypothetical protein AV530_000190 [Patagioenas fasciata monilis]|uniref:Striatin N-terminal domain-containing protein n=1 Tax=Patagioenas fasciata monilis TaxID=372326 RepID=A0A1V4J526_PATFA|nr:hypothetical protein AV530_000190 [Patagioenas fasciata monilis]
MAAERAAPAAPRAHPPPPAPGTPPPGPGPGSEPAGRGGLSLPGILHFIQHEWARFEAEKGRWEAERAELQPCHLVVAFRTGVTALYDVTVARPLLLLDTRGGAINQVVCHPGQPVIVTAGDDRAIRFLDTRAGHVVHSMVAHLDAVTCLAIDPSGGFLMSGSEWPCPQPVPPSPPLDDDDDDDDSEDALGEFHFLGAGDAGGPPRPPELERLRGGLGDTGDVDGIPPKTGSAGPPRPHEGPPPDPCFQRVIGDRDVTLVMGS